MDDGAAAYPVPDSLTEKPLLGIVGRQLVEITGSDKPLIFDTSNARILAAPRQGPDLEFVVTDRCIRLSSFLNRL